MKPSKIYLSIIVCFLIALLISACQAETNASAVEEAPPIEPTATIIPTPEHPSKILFIGAGLMGANGGVQTHLQKLVIENESLPDIDVETSYKSHNSIGSMWRKSKELYAIEDFDYVVACELLQNFWDNGAGKFDFFKEVRNIDSQATENGVELILLMQWADDGTRYGLPTQDIADAHTEIADELGIKVAPVGLAFEAAQRERPDYELLEDEIGPNWRGTYLATLVLYATIYHENPAGLTYQIGDMWGDLEMFKYRVEEWHLSEDELSFLQRIAWETVISYPQSGVTE